MSKCQIDSGWRNEASVDHPTTGGVAIKAAKMLEGDDDGNAGRVGTSAPHTEAHANMVIEPTAVFTGHELRSCWRQGAKKISIKNAIPTEVSIASFDAWKLEGLSHLKANRKCGVWDRRRGRARYTRNERSTVPNRRLFASWSSKPVQQASPGPRLELFARAAAEGWTVWGD